MNEGLSYGGDGEGTVIYGAIQPDRLSYRLFLPLFNLMTSTVHNIA